MNLGTAQLGTQLKITINVLVRAGDSSKTWGFLPSLCGSCMIPIEYMLDHVRFSCNSQCSVLFSPQLIFSLCFGLDHFYWPSSTILSVLMWLSKSYYYCFTSSISIGHFLIVSMSLLKGIVLSLWICTWERNSLCMFILPVIHCYFLLLDVFR